MLALMLSVIYAQLEVIKMVIVSDVILMVDAFGWDQIATQIFFHNEGMFKDVPLSSAFFPVGMWMIRHKYVNVTVRSFIFALEVPRGAAW